MVQKYLAMVAILGAIAGLGIGMVTMEQKVKADPDEGWYPCHWKGPGFACLNNGFTQPAQKQI